MSAVRSMDDMKDDEEVAACGLLCHECSIYQSANDENIAENVRDWFLEMGWLNGKVTVEEFMKDAPYCSGCHGERETHWSPTCWILRCCVDDKGLDNCSQCPDFPCSNLENWATEDEGYKEALDRLKAMKEKRNMSE